MSKIAQAVSEESGSQAADSESDKLFLKKKKEEEIRMRLDEFARELAAAREARKAKK